MIKSIINKIKHSAVLKNFSILSGANLIAQALSLLSSIRIAPLLGSELYGYYNWILVLASIFSVLSVFGLRIILIRSVAREPNQTRTYFFRALCIRSFFLILSLIIFIIYNYFSESISELYAILSIMALVTTTTLWDTIESIAFGRQIMKFSAFIELGSILIWVISLYLLPNESFTVKNIISIYVIIQFVKNIVYFVWLFFSGLISKIQEAKIKPALSFSEMIKQSSSYFILAVFTSLQNQFPIIFLEQNSGLSQVGIYNIGFRILNPLQMLINTALTALFPNLSILWQTNPQAFYEKCKKGILILLLVSITGCLVVTVLSKDIILLLYGKEYEQSSYVIAAQCWYTAIYGFFCFIGNTWGASNKQRRMAILSVISTCISLPIFWYGSKFGAEGLAFSFIISSLINLSYHWYFLSAKTFTQRISLKYSLSIWGIFLFYMFAGLYIPQQLSLINKLGILIILLIPIVFLSRKFLVSGK